MASSRRLHLALVLLLLPALAASLSRVVGGASPVDPACRSLMNVPFTIPSAPDAEKDFVKEATAAGLKELKGHRSVGGMRASVYNSMPMAGVDALAAFMKAFADTRAL
jgi:phosphoserine aminotransferase